MTADDYERQIISTLELLRMYSSELTELVAFVSEDAEIQGVELVSRAPFFEQEER